MAINRNEVKREERREKELKAKEGVIYFTGVPGNLVCRLLTSSPHNYVIRPPITYDRSLLRERFSELSDSVSRYLVLALNTIINCLVSSKGICVLLYTGSDCYLS